MAAFILMAPSCTDESDPTFTDYSGKFKVLTNSIGNFKLKFKDISENALNYRLSNDQTQQLILAPVDGGGELSPADRNHILSTVDNLNSLVATLENYNLEPIYNLQGAPSTDLLVEFNTNELLNVMAPAVHEAKNYLKRKGFSELEIDEMISHEGGSELDLIPLVSTMANVERSNFTSFHFSDILITPALAITSQDVFNCGMAAIGADILWALGSSNASKWSKKAIKKAFGVVAKRALGPIGVAIAVVSFSTCLAAVS
ncbi:hypothetical protein [Algoriphagus limi]|uniref:Uncharacterized protein n=1 Tax=Algoriphagus limi TaxID=2975273 RepID=A0ABT2GA79_9BACT|nr:hypothetical protein [Algoriphagus limi]MCS5491346.1 hypothetical protein [Algoriphagus limi]